MDFPGFSSWDDDFTFFKQNRNRYNEAYGEYTGGYAKPRPMRRQQNFNDEPYDFPMDDEDEEPMGPPMPKRRFNPRGPVPPPQFVRADMGAKLLLRFGVPPVVVNALPPEMLAMFEPNYCGLCGNNFDSPMTASSHYVSKYHSKNQRKWINQRLGGQIPNQKSSKPIPLKARELYCELCDVQITSVSHADSHYAGKSHHAVVLGRKNPKNPLLLQRGMESRIQQLIRREKKFLNDHKPAENTQKEEAKASVPELYCDICKTSMTCSEQMTAHLNGKRHLAKEKQYILKKMSGEIEETEEGMENQTGNGNETAAESQPEQGQPEQYDQDEQQNDQTEHNDQSEQFDHSEQYDQSEQYDSSEQFNDSERYSAVEQ